MLGDLFPRTIVASPHLAWFWLYCCVPHKIFSISSSSLRPVCFDRRNAARPPGSRLNILSDTNSGFYSIRNPADTHCCPSRTNPAFLLVGWCHTGLAKTPICQQQGRIAPLLAAFAAAALCTFVSKSWYRQAKDMYRYCCSECVLVLSVPCILTVLGIAIVIEHVSRKRYNCTPAKSSRCKI